MINPSSLSLIRAGFTASAVLFLAGCGRKDPAVTPTTQTPTPNAPVASNPAPPPPPPQAPAPAAKAPAAAASSPLGYTDTPVIPGTPWRVHDGERPRPAIVTPGATFSHLAPPPSDAIVLFDGKDVSKWSDRNGGEAKWKLNDGALESVRGTGMIRTRDKFADFQLHLEFATPATVEGSSQGRGNSGVMINGMYEVQILDSYDNPTYADGQAAALYGQYPPLVNASKPPGQWQTYEIVFESPRWDAAGELVKKAAVTVIHNGVVVQHRREYFGRTDGIGGTAHKSLGTYGQPHPPAVYIELQDHNNPVRFRNIWIRELRLTEAK